MPTALFLSPHLDDAAFSCAGAMQRYHDPFSGWNICHCTVFTKSVPDPTGFALRCQTDKNIAPDVDYMALRRREDIQFARIMGVKDVRHWDFAEAPHRGYESPAMLFAGILDGDEIWKRVAEKLQDLARELDLACIWAPQGLGNHVDHLQLIRAVQQTFAETLICWYRDTPYAIREPSARQSPLLPLDVRENPFLLSEEMLVRKIAGACAYESQIGFQFGGPDEVACKLREFHRAEAVRFGREGYVEAHLTVE